MVYVLLRYTRVPGRVCTVPVLLVVSGRRSDTRVRWSTHADGYPGRVPVVSVLLTEQRVHLVSRGSTIPCESGSRVSTVYFRVIPAGFWFFPAIIGPFGNSLPTLRACRSLSFRFVFVFSRKKTEKKKEKKN